MDYSKRLDQSIENFEREAGKLTQIAKLLDDTAKLIAEIRAGKETLQQSSARLSEMKTQIAADCHTLAKFSANERTARQKLLADIHALATHDTAQAIKNLSQPLNAAHENLTRTTETFAESVAKMSAAVEENAEANGNFRAEISNALEEYIRAETQARQKLVADIHVTVAGDAKKIADEISAPLKQSNAELSQTCAQLAEFVETHKKSQAAFLTEIEALLIRYNDKNIEVYNSITDELDKLQSSIRGQFFLQNDYIKKNANDLNSKIQELSVGLQKVSVSVEFMKEQMSKSLLGRFFR